MRLVNRRILELLNSPNHDLQVRGLSALGAERAEKPSKEVFARALELLKTGDNEVKEYAVFALALHWACPKAYPIILSLLDGGSEDEGVLDVSASSLRRYRNSETFNRKKALSLLARMVLDSELSSELRGTCYISMLDIDGRIPDKKTLASMPDEIDNLDVKWSWVEENCIHE